MTPSCSLTTHPTALDHLPRCQQRSDDPGLFGQQSTKRPLTIWHGANSGPMTPSSSAGPNRRLGGEFEVLDFDHHRQQIADVETVQLQHAVVFNFVVDDLDSVVAFGQSLGPVQDLV